jgi:hypothetical protein
VTCLWDDCGVIFTHLPTLITHIHDGAFALSISDGFVASHSVRDI